MHLLRHTLSFTRPCLRHSLWHTAPGDGHHASLQVWVSLEMQLDLERKLRTLLTKEKEKAEEEAALSMGLCTGGSIF